MKIYFSNDRFLEFAHASITHIRDNSYTIRDLSNGKTYNVPMSSVLYIVE